MNDYQDDSILYLSRSDVEKICNEIESMTIIHEVFSMHGTHQTLLPDEACIYWQNARGETVRSLNMPGYIGGTICMAGTKIINSNIQNPQRGLPRASGLTFLYDNDTARVVCIMEGAYISSLRTASVSALAATMLTSQSCNTLAIIGAGVLAQAHIELLIKSDPRLQHILLYDIDGARIDSLQQQLNPLFEKHNVTLHVTSTAEEAIRAAQLIVPVTTTTQGYIHFAWLQAGSVLINVSLDDPLPEVVLRADRVIVDDWNLVKCDSRRLLGRMYRAGQIVGPDDMLNEQNTHCRRIDAEIGDIVTGRKEGRLREDEIILVNPFGLAIEDIGVASWVYDRARESKLGIRLAR